jgi:hypothetical protein
MCATQLAISFPDSAETAGRSASSAFSSQTKIKEHGVGWRTVIEAYVRYDCAKKKQAMPDFERLSSLVTKTLQYPRNTAENMSCRPALPRLVKIFNDAQFIKEPGGVGIGANVPTSVDADTDFYRDFSKKTELASACNGALYKEDRGRRSEITPALRFPAVYLDYGVIADLAGTEKGVLLRDHICAKGTLYLSWVHLLEIFSLREGGGTFKRISDYLESFGPHFAIIEVNAKRVIERESKFKPGQQNPALDLEVLSMVAANWSGTGELSTAVLLSSMAKQPSLFDEVKRLQSDHKNDIQAIFLEQRHRYRTDAAYKKNLDAVVYNVTDPFITDKVFFELLRICTQTQEEFKGTDATDFEHAVVSISYAKHVVLDRQWAARCRRVKLPSDRCAAIYSGPQIDQVIGSLERD